MGGGLIGGNHFEAFVFHVVNVQVVVDVVGLFAGILGLRGNAVGVALYQVEGLLAPLGVCQVVGVGPEGVVVLFGELCGGHAPKKGVGTMETPHAEQHSHHQKQPCEASEMFIVC